MTGLVSLGIVLLAVEPAAADTHTFEVIDRLGEHRVRGRRNTMRGCCQFLTERDGKLVVDPAMSGVPQPCVTILRGDQHVRRAGDALEILGAPWVNFAN